MRQSMTISERRLWNRLRDRTFDGIKFRRQVPMGRFVLDFYSPRLRLAIEVDGAHHESPDMLQYDDERTRWLAERGIRVVRVPNALLAKDSWIVEEQLHYWIEQRRQEVG